VDDLNTYMEDHCIDHETRRLLRIFYLNSKSSFIAQGNGRVIEFFSPNLRIKCVKKYTGDFSRFIPYINRPRSKICPDGLLIDVVIQLFLGMCARNYSPQEKIGESDSLLYLTKGVAAREGRIMIRGQIFCYDFVLEEDWLKFRSEIIVLTYTEVQEFPRSKWDDVVATLSNATRDSVLSGIRKLRWGRVIIVLSRRYAKQKERERRNDYKPPHQLSHAPLLPLGNRCPNSHVSWEKSQGSNNNKQSSCFSKEEPSLQLILKKLDELELQIKARFPGC